MLAIALILDAVLGEPEPLWRRLPHPIVLIGRAIARLERGLNRGAYRRVRGGLAMAFLLLPLGGLGVALSQPLFGGVAEVLLAAVLLAQRSLVEHVRDVADALDRTLGEGRAAVSRIVGRDPDALDEAGVARAAIESAAENFSDGVVAPAFWFAVAGLPGILLYKAINTADSMIGHRTQRYEAFGWAAARLDDLANLVPARLSAVLMVCAGGRLAALRIVLRDAGLHRSPNAGWPEAAMAACLGVAVSGPRSYHGTPTSDPWVHAEGRRNANASDVRAACRLLWRAWAVLLLLAGGLVIATA
ncbi:MAG: adenosylcobinamide-phosphate synthase CbiB [Pseudomonadota bacterium]